ncbi:MAG: MlaE family ABC transporter permease [Acidimicrobiales bacterium]
MTLQAPPSSRDRIQTGVSGSAGGPDLRAGERFTVTKLLAMVASMVAGVGGAIVAFFVLVYDQVSFSMRAFMSMPAALRHRKELALLVSDIAMGAGALVIGGGMFLVVMSITFFTGTVVGLEGYTGLHLIGAQALTGVISSLANTREIVPLVAGDAFAAQVGASFTAQLGAMRISEEIDALEVMGVDPVAYLVGTRIWASIITMIPLYTAALFASYVATELMVTRFFTLSTGVYQHYFKLFLSPMDVFDSYIKAIVFVIFITIVHCFYGYYAKGGPAGVGEATGRAIRISLIGIVILSLFMSMLMFGGLNSTSARLVG